MLRRRGVKVVEHAEVTGIACDRVALAVGVELRYDLVLLATGTRPPSIFTDSGLPTEYSGGLLVNEYLQIPKYP